jgi:DNA-binding transcriptional LysR family regulator
VDRREDMAGWQDEGRRPAAATLHRRHAIIRHLPYFVVVAEQEHFQRAAEILNMTQPALSRRIQDMEAELGVELFERKRRGVRLTEAGRLLREDGLRILATMDGALHRLRALSGTERQHLRLSFNESALRNAEIRDAVEGLRDAFPEVEVDLMPMLTDAQIAGLQRRELNGCFLFDFGFRQLGFSVMPIAIEPMVLVVPADHPIRRLPTVRLRDIAEEPLSWPSRTAGSRLHERMSAAWAAAGLTPNIRMEVLTSDTTISLAANHMAVGFATANARLTPEVALAPIADFKVDLELSLVWHPDDESPPLRRLVELLGRRGA